MKRILQYDDETSEPLQPQSRVPIESKLASYSAKISNSATPKKENSMSSPDALMASASAACSSLVNSIQRIGETEKDSGVQGSFSAAKYRESQYISREVHDYSLKLGFNESQPLKKLRLRTDKHKDAVMMAHPTEVALFSVILPAMNAKKAIEVGVYTGYTTMAIAQALGVGGTVVALDIINEYCEIGRPYWKEAGVDDRIDLRIGLAQESLQKMIDNNESDTYDFAFIDADKANYKTYYEMLLKLIRKNGIIAIDNVLWDGEVVNEYITDETTAALREISAYVYLDNRVEHVLLPFADGVTLVRKN